MTQEDFVAVKAITGKSNHPKPNGGQAALIVLVMLPEKRGIGKTNAKKDEVFLGLAATEGNVPEVVQAKKGRKLDALTISGGSQSNYGSWYEKDLLVQEGTLIKLFATYKPKGAQFSLKESCNMILRVRKEAALLKIALPLAGIEDSNLEEGYLIGNFDILTAKEIESAVKNSTFAYRTSQFSDTKVKRVLRVTCLCKEKSAPRAVVQKSVGEESTIAVRINPRKIVLY